MAIPVTANLVQLLVPSSLSAYANGDLVDAWADTSGAGNNLASSGTNRPTKISNGVQFVLNDFLAGPLVNAGTSGLTAIICMSDPLVTGASGGVLVIHDGTTDTNNKCHIVFEQSSAFGPFSNSSGTIAISAFPAGEQFLIDRFNTGVCAFGLYPFIVKVASGANITTGSAGIVYGSRHFSSTSPTPSFYARYKLHGAAIYNAALTDPQIVSVVEWFRQELGLLSTGSAAKPSHPMSQQVIG